MPGLIPGIIHNFFFYFYKKETSGKEIKSELPEVTFTEQEVICAIVLLEQLFS